MSQERELLNEIGKEIDAGPRHLWRRLQKLRQRIDSIRTTPAQPAAEAQEPVAWRIEHSAGVGHWHLSSYKPDVLPEGVTATPLYTRPAAAATEGWRMVPVEPRPDVINQLNAAIENVWECTGSAFLGGSGANHDRALIYGMLCEVGRILEYTVLPHLAAPQPKGGERE